MPVQADAESELKQSSPIMILIAIAKNFTFITEKSYIGFTIFYWRHISYQTEESEKSKYVAVATVLTKFFEKKVWR
jgi:hypothetical protein